MNRLFVIGALLFLLGCAEIGSHVMAEKVEGGKTYQKVNADNVRVISSERNAPEGYQIVARLKSTGDFCCDSTDQLFRSFQEKAGFLGADAVILQRVTKERKDVIARSAEKDANDLSGQDRFAPVTYTEVPFALNLYGGKYIFKGYALAVRLKP